MRKCKKLIFLSEVSSSCGHAAVREEGFWNVARVVSSKITLTSEILDTKPHGAVVTQDGERAALMSQVLEKFNKRIVQTLNLKPEFIYRRCLCFCEEFWSGLKPPEPLTDAETCFYICVLRSGWLDRNFPSQNTTTGLLEQLTVLLNEASPWS